MKSFKQVLFAVALAVTAVLSTPAWAQATKPAGDMTEAEVRKVDKENKKITLKHGAIKNLDMPAMTMVFGVNDAAMLDKVQAGDKVQFKATNDAGKFTVTEIQSVK
jgi:Cu(I)/Ag(I) efflux system periplasmic protein CusF